jgi:hypothetical protein
MNFYECEFFLQIQCFILKIEIKISDALQAP